MFCRRSNFKSICAQVRILLSFKYRIVCVLILLLLGYVIFRRNKLEMEIDSDEPTPFNSTFYDIYDESVVSSDVEATLPRYPSRLTDAEDFQVVAETNSAISVYSAFYDGREGFRMIRIIGITQLVVQEKLWCRLWHASGKKFRSFTVKARVQAIRENFGLPFTASFIMCPLEDVPSFDVPFAVSIVRRLRSTPSNLLPVIDNNSSSFGDPPMRNLAVCVPTVHNSFDKAISLIEFFEMQNLLGVSHFTFYVHTLGPKASCVMQNYVDGKILSHESITPKITVEALPWNFTLQFDVNIRGEALFASLNDCLYRSMYRYSYAAFIDLDEFIFPKAFDNLIDMIESFPKHLDNNVKTGGYNFRNGFFYLQFPDDEIVSQDNSTNFLLRKSLVTITKTRRKEQMLPHDQRSKYICKPEVVVEVGNHFIWEFRPEYTMLQVQPDVAISHHYRVSEIEGDDCVKDPSVTEKTAHKHRLALEERVGAVYNQLKEVCQLQED